MELEAVLREFTPMVPREEIERRIEAFQKMLQDGGLYGALLFHVPDVYYLSGTKQDGLLFLPSEGEGLLLISRHPRRAAVESPVPVVPLKSLRRLPELLPPLKKGALLGTELDLITLSTINRWKKSLPDVEFKDVSTMIRELKAVKSPWEIETMKRSAHMLDVGYNAMLFEMREGISEVELSSHIYSAMRREGYEGGETMRNGRMEGFVGHVLSGWSAAIPSYMNAPTNGMGISPSMPMGPSWKKLEKGDTVIFDHFGTYLGYLVDMTRTAALGEPSSKLKDAHKVLLDIHSYLKEALREGGDGADVYEGVMKIAKDSPYGDNFMGYDDVGVNFVGHGVGTEIDEFPFIARGFEMPLKAGMVVAVEPKFLFPGEGAVGIENTYLIGENGTQALTTTPMELKVV
jgi:Xaa-Pro dipeptidase